MVEAEERGRCIAVLLKVQMWDLRELGCSRFLGLVCEAGGYAMLVSVRLNSAKAQVELARMDSEDSQSEWGTKVN